MKHQPTRRITAMRALDLLREVERAGAWARSRNNGSEACKFEEIAGILADHVKAHLARKPRAKGRE